MSFVEDFAVFFPPGDPGVAAALINGEIVYGDLMDDLELTLDTGVVRGADPAFRCAFADLPPFAVGDLVTIGAISYTVRELEHNFHSPLATLHLNKAT